MPATSLSFSIQPVNTGYIICTTPRSGSTLLCTLLEATKQTGQPDSFYHEPHLMQEWADAWGLPDAGIVPPTDYDKAYLEATIAAGRGSTSLFGMRLQQAYMPPLAATLARLYPDLQSDAERFERAFGSLRYLHLTRLDKVAQAVSLVKARQSGLWHRHADGSERERVASAADPVYDPAAIEAEVASLTRADRAWSAWFAQEQIEPLRIIYETFGQRPAATVQYVCVALGVEPPDSMTITPVVAKLADGINQNWIARFRADERHDEHTTSESDVCFRS